jgi:hypothetical protein
MNLEVMAVDFSLCLPEAISFESLPGHSVEVRFEQQVTLESFIFSTVFFWAIRCWDNVPAVYDVSAGWISKPQVCSPTKIRVKWNVVSLAERNPEPPIGREAQTVLLCAMGAEIY